MIRVSPPGDSAVHRAPGVLVKSRSKSGSVMSGNNLLHRRGWRYTCPEHCEIGVSFIFFFLSLSDQFICREG